MIIYVAYNRGIESIEELRPEDTPSRNFVLVETPTDSYFISTLWSLY